MVRFVVSINRDNVETALLKKNQPKKWLAERLGMKQAYLTQLLNGKRSVSPTVRYRIGLLFRGRLKWDDIFTIVRKQDGPV